MENRFNREVSETLLRMPLLHGVGASVAGVLACSARLVDFNRGQEIYRVGDPAGELFFVVQGQVKRASAFCGGDEKFLELVGPGQSFGASELFGKRAYSSLAVSLKPSRLLCVSAEAMHHALASDGRLMTRMLALMANRILDMEGEAAATQFRSGVERVLDYLLKLSGGCKFSGESVVVLETRKKLIASRLGMAPETFSRLLRELSDSGLIAIDGRTVTLQHRRIAERLAEIGDTEASGNSHDSTGTAAQGAGLPPLLGPCAVINIAGRQRFLTQRMAKAWLMFGKDVSPVRARTILNESMRQFEQNMATLVAMSADERVRGAHAAVGQAWQPFRLTLQDAPTHAGAASIYDLSEKTLAAAEDLTDAYERAISTETPRARLVNLAARQRMLSQRLGKLFMFLQWEVRVPECRRAIIATTTEYEKASDILKTEALGHNAIVAQLKRVDRNWDRLKSALEAQNPDPRRHASAVSNISESLLRQVDIALIMYQKLVA